MVDESLAGHGSPRCFEALHESQQVPCRNPPQLQAIPLTVQIAELANGGGPSYSTSFTLTSANLIPLPDPLVYPDTEISPTTGSYAFPVLPITGPAFNEAVRLTVTSSLGRTYSVMVTGGTGSQNGTQATPARIGPGATQVRINSYSPPAGMFTDTITMRMESVYDSSHVSEQSFVVTRQEKPMPTSIAPIANLTTTGYQSGQHATGFSYALSGGWTSNLVIEGETASGRVVQVNPWNGGTSSNASPSSLTIPPATGNLEFRILYQQPEGPYSDTVTLRFYPQGRPELTETRSFTISRAAVLLPGSFVISGNHSVSAAFVGTAGYKESSNFAAPQVNVPLIATATNLTGNPMRICRQGAQQCGNFGQNPSQVMELGTTSIRIYYDFPPGPISDTVTVTLRSSADPSQVLTQSYAVVKP